MYGGWGGGVGGSWFGGGMGGGGGTSEYALPPKVQEELMALESRAVPGVILQRTQDRLGRKFVVYLIDHQGVDTLEAAPVKVEVTLPIAYPTSPPVLVISGQSAPWMDQRGVVDVFELRGDAWAGIDVYNYDGQLRTLLLRIKELIFEPPSPAPVPAPAPIPLQAPEAHRLDRLARLTSPDNAVGPDAGSGAPGVARAAHAAQMAHTGSGGAGTVHTAPRGHTGGGVSEPALQPQAQPTGKPFRISVLAGKSKEVGGFMQGRALKQLRFSDRLAGNDWRHAITTKSLWAACQQIGAEGPQKENPPGGQHVSMRVWNLTDYDVMITWPGCGSRKPNEGYDPTSCDNGKRLDGQHPNWAKFQLKAAVGTVFTFSCNGHKERYKVTKDSAQAVFITAGMVLEDSALRSEPEPEQPSAVVEPPRLQKFESNMTLMKWRIMENTRYFVFKDGLMSQWDKADHVKRRPPIEEPLHIWKTDLEQSVDGSDHVVVLTVKQPHSGYAVGDKIRLKCKYEHTHKAAVDCILNFQQYGAWLEQQWHSPGNMERTARGKSKAGTPILESFLSGFEKKYESPAKVMLTETVIPRGCRHADATMVVDTIHGNQAKARNDHALQDVEQTCEAFKAHFDRRAKRDECIQQFAFCLFFYTAMREALQAIGQRAHRDKFEAARQRLEDVLKFLKRVLLESTGQRAALRKALAECDIEFCQQMLLNKHTGKIVLPLSDLQVTGRPARLSRANEWEMFFTMLLLEGTVFRRLQEVQVSGPHGQPAELGMEDIARRIKPNQPLHTSSTYVSAGQLGDIVSAAAAEGCFDNVRFCRETFAYIAFSIYSFPTVARPGVAAEGYAQAMDVAEFFELATKCSMTTPEVFQAIRPNILRNGKGRMRATFLLEFNHVLRGLQDMSVDRQRETDQLFVSYFEGFMPRHNFLSDSIYNLYLPLLESRQLDDLMPLLFEAIMRRVHAEPPQLTHIVEVLSKEIAPGHPLKRDPLIHHVFFGSQPARGPVRRSAEYRLAQYKPDIVRVLELLQHNWSLDFSGKGEIIVSKVASDALQLGTTYDAYERLAVICEVIKDPNFRTLVHSTTDLKAQWQEEAQMWHIFSCHRQVDDSFNDIIDGLKVDGLTAGVLEKLLGDSAPADEYIKWHQTVPSPVLSATYVVPATYVVWQQICERLGRNVNEQPAVKRLKILKLLAASGWSASSRPKLLACTMFYSAVLLRPILSASAFLQMDVRPWSNLIKGDYFPLISLAIEILRQGMDKCEHPLTNEHLAPLDNVEAAIAAMRNAFEKNDLSKGELQRISEILQVDATGAVGRVMEMKQHDIKQRLDRVDADLERLQVAQQVVQFLGTLNVDRWGDEQKLATLIAESNRCPIGDIMLCADDFDQKYRTGVQSLGDKLYDLVAHFQREKSVIFDATVDTLRRNSIGQGVACDVERAEEFMNSVDEQLLKVLARTVTVDKLRPILPALQNCDIPAEINRLRSWKRYKTVNDQAAQDIMRCMELLQQVQNVPTVLDVLRKYAMVADDDPDAEKLRRIHGTFEEDGSQDEMALVDVPSNCQELDALFSGLKATHFKLIETIKGAEHLVRFLDAQAVDGMDFYSEQGKRNFADKKRLVDVQIQASASRQFHSQLLSAFELDAMPVCKCFAELRQVPLRDAIQAIANVERLKDLDEGGINSLCQKIKKSNDQIATIRSWFTRAQVSTFENAAFVMLQLQQTGKVKIQLKDLIFDGMSTQEKKKFKAFQIEYRPQADMGVDGVNTILPTLSIDEVDELQRQLTFSLQQHAKDSDDYAQGKASLDVLHLLRTIFKRLTALQDSGHPFYQNRNFEFYVRTDEGHRRELVSTERNYTLHLNDWEQSLKRIRRDTKQLQMLTCVDMVIIVHLLSQHSHGDQANTRKVLRTLLGSEVDLTTEAEVTRAVHFCVGNLLRPIGDLCVCDAGLHSTDTQQKTNSVTRLLQPLCDRGASAEDVVRATTDALVELVEKIFTMRPGHNSGVCGTQISFKVENPSDVFSVLLREVFREPEVPNNSQILWCSDKTNGRDVALFFQRVRSFRSHNFAVCGMGRLSPSTRERVYEQQQELHRRQKEQEFANVYYITLGTSSAIGSVAHFVREQKVPVRPAAKLWPRPGIATCSPRRVLALVGDPGSGKTHKLNRLRAASTRDQRKIQVLSLVDNIHRDAVSRKLASLEFQRADGDAHCSVFINISDVVTHQKHGKGTIDEGENDRLNFFYDVNRLLFEVMVLGYTQQTASGATFTLSDDDMEIVVEVPARQHAHEDYLAMMPVLQVVGADQEVQDERTNLYEIEIPNAPETSQAQRVAIVLNALHTHNRQGRLIDKVANYDRNGNAQNKLPRIDTADECRQIIMNQLTNEAQIRDLVRDSAPLIRGQREGDYFVAMCAKIAASKLLQKCFLAYLGRRCEYYFKDMSQYSLNGDPSMKLGTTTARQFIRESIELCDNEHDVDDNGEYLLLGEDYYLALLRKTHAGLGMPTCSSPDLAKLVGGTDSDIDRALGTEQADIDKEDRLTIQTRLEGRWDHYLARGLAFGGNAKIGSSKVRQVLDRMHFVMVSDFCFKIIHIHERKLARLPVIIEGETGVGKTYLLDCYANLLASQLKRTRPEPPRQLVRVCVMMQALCAKIIAIATNGPLRDLADRPLAMNQLEARRWQLENETTADYGADNTKRNEHPIDTPAMLEQWQWIVAIGCPDQAARGAADWTWLPDDTKDAIKTLCVETLVESVTEWRKIPLLDLHGEFNGLERRAMAVTSEFEEHTAGDFQVKVNGWLGDSNDRMIVETKRVLQSFLTCGSIPMFYRLMVHPGITPDDVMQFLAPIRELARLLQRPKGSYDKVSEVNLVCFFDEVNTATCQGLIKEILYDRSFGGDQLEDNLFFIAAINPDKRKAGVEEDDEHLAFIDGKRAVSVKAIHREIYTVNKMHPVLRKLKWNYTKLNRENLKLYIHHKVTSYSNEGTMFHRATHDMLAHIIELSQDFMFEHLGKSAVSQRDVQRCFSLIEFFRQHAPEDLKAEMNEEQMMQSAVMLAASVTYFFRLPQEEVLGLDNSPVRLRDRYLKTIERACRNRFLVTVKRCVNQFVTPHNFKIQKGIALNQALKENIFCMVAALETNIPVSIIGLPGSSKTLSFQIVQRNLRGEADSPTEFCKRFKEIQAFFYQCNEYSTEQEIASVFNLAIERQNDLDAAAGRSKSNKRCVVFLDEASLPDEKKMVLKVLHPFLDEHRVAAVVISNVPLDAANANRLIEVHRGLASDDDLEVLARGCLGVEEGMVTDEMAKAVKGLCQGYKKVIECSERVLVEGRIACGQEAEVCGLIGGSEYLNGTKAIVKSYDSEACTYEVSITLGGEIERPAPISAENLRRIEVRKLFRSFHFRDFIYLLRHINRVKPDGQLTSLNARTLFKALECNFGGIPDDQFKYLADIFFSEVSKSLGDDEFEMPSEEEMRTPLEVFRQSLKDAKEATRTSEEYSELHPRFKLIIDSSEDDSAARLLETVGVKFDKVFRMSDFPDDNTELHYARLISDIKMSMERGDTILLIDTDRIQGSFYDLFNQNYNIMAGDKDKQMLYSNVAVGAASHMCRVDKNFQCVVHMREKELSTKPAPFLSRFEKYRLSISDFMQAQRAEISGIVAGRSAALWDYVYARVLSFVEHVEKKHFLGFGDSTLASLFMSHVRREADGQLSFCPFSRWTEGCRADIKSAAQATSQSKDQEQAFIYIQALCARLLQLVPPEVATLYIKGSLGVKPDIYRRAYFHTQEHLDFRSLVQTLVNHGREQADSDDCIAASRKTVVMTRSSPDVIRFGHIDGADGTSSTRDQLRDYFHPAGMLPDLLDVARLDKYKSSLAFEEKLDEFIADAAKEILIIVADGSLTSTKHLNYCRHLLDIKSKKFTGCDVVLSYEQELEPEPEYERGEPEPEPDPDFAEPAATTIRKQFVLLLHFAPESILTRQDYPTVFLAGWDYMYIDSTATHRTEGAKTLTSILAGKTANQPDVDDLELIKFDQLFTEALWRFCSLVEIGHCANSVPPEDMVSVSAFYGQRNLAGQREMAFRRMFDNHPQLIKTISDGFFKTFKRGDVSKKLEDLAIDIVSGAARQGLSDLCHEDLMKSFSAHCVPYFLALANDFGLVSLAKLKTGKHRAIPDSLIVPMLAGIKPDDVLAAGGSGKQSFTVTWKSPTNYELPMFRILEGRVRHHFDNLVLQYPPTTPHARKKLKEALHAALQNHRLTRVLAGRPRQAGGGQLEPELLLEVCQMYALDAARNLSPHAGEHGDKVAHVVRRWLLCDFDPLDESTDILTHVQMAQIEVDVSTDSNATRDAGKAGLKKLNAICQALNKLQIQEGGDREEDDVQNTNRKVFISQMEKQLSNRLWKCMTSLVDDYGQTMDMRAWEQRLAQWLAAFQFVRRHFPPGRKLSKKEERQKWHAMSAVLVIARCPNVSDQLRRDLVQKAIVNAGQLEGGTSVRKLIDDTTALFGDDAVAAVSKRGLVSEIIMWWTDAASENWISAAHKASEEDFTTCLSVINTDPLLLPTMAAHLLKQLCECAAPGWPEEERSVVVIERDVHRTELRQLNAAEQARHDEFEAALLAEMEAHQDGRLALLLSNQIVHEQQERVECTGGIRAQEILDRNLQLATIMDNNVLNRTKKSAITQWLVEAAGRYCALPLDHHATENPDIGTMADPKSGFGLAMRDVLNLMTAELGRDAVLTFAHIIEQRAGPNHLQALLDRPPFNDHARYPWVKEFTDKLKLEVDPAGGKYARQLPFTFATAENPHPPGMHADLTHLYTEFSEIFERCILNEPPEFEPLKDFCVGKADAASIRAHLKMCMLVKVYYDHYTRPDCGAPKDRLRQLCNFVRDEDLQCLQTTPEEKKLLLCILQPAANIAGYDSDTNFLARRFRIDNKDSDDLLQRDLLVNVAAVAMGAGTEHHLYTHMFSANKLHTTWGFIAGGTVSIQGAGSVSHYDCGCKMQQDGSLENNKPHVSREAVLMGISTCYAALCWTLLCGGDPGGLDKVHGPVLTPAAISSMAEDMGFAGANRFENTCHFASGFVTQANTFLKQNALELDNTFAIFYNQCLVHFFVHAGTGAYKQVYRSDAERTQAEQGWVEHVVRRALDTYAAQDEHISRVRQQKAKELGDDINDARTHIVENILTLKCPKCSGAFVDFTGCFALTCTRDGCGCGFCAYCLMDCGGDAHAHVKQCELNPSKGSYGGGQAQFEQCQLARRERLVRQYLIGMDEGRRKRVAQRCRQDFEQNAMAGILQEFAADTVEEGDGLLPEIAAAGRKLNVHVSYPAFQSALQNKWFQDDDAPRILLQYLEKRKSLQLLDLIVPIAKLYFFVHESLGHIYSEEESLRETLLGAVRKYFEGLVLISNSRTEAEARRAELKRQSKIDKLIKDHIQPGIDGVNRFHMAEGGTLQPGACDARENFDKINDSTLLYTVLSDPKNEGGTDILYRIIKYLVSTQNLFLRFARDHSGRDPVVRMDVATLAQTQISLFDVLATSGGLLSAQTDNFQVVCPAFCTEDPIVRSKLMSLEYDFTQCQRFVTSLLAGHSIIDEDSLRTVFAFKKDIEDGVELHAKFSERMDERRREDTRERLIGLQFDHLERCRAGLQKYLIGILKLEPAYVSGNEAALEQMSRQTIEAFSKKKLVDITDFDCDIAFAQIKELQLRYLKALVEVVEESCQAAQDSGTFPTIPPHCRVKFKTDTLATDLERTFVEKLALLSKQPGIAKDTDLLEHAIKFLSNELIVDELRNHVDLPLFQYAKEFLLQDQDDDMLLFWDPGAGVCELPDEVKVENILFVCTVLYELRQARTKDDLRSRTGAKKWQELDAVRALEVKISEAEETEEETEGETKDGTPFREPDLEEEIYNESDSEIEFDPDDPDEPDGPAERRRLNADDSDEDLGVSAEEQERIEQAHEEKRIQNELRAAEEERKEAVRRTARAQHQDGVQAAELEDWDSAIAQFDAALQEQAQLETWLINELNQARQDAVEKLAVSKRKTAVMRATTYFNDAENRMASRELDAAMEAYRAGLECAEELNDQALIETYRRAMEECKNAATSEHVIAEIAVVFEECTEAFEDSGTETKPLIPWDDAGAEKVSSTFTIHALDGTTKPTNLPTLHSRSMEKVVAKANAWKAFKKDFPDCGEVAVLNPSYIMISKDVPVTWPPADLQDRDEDQDSGDGYAVKKKGETRNYQPLYAAVASALTTVSIELDSAFAQSSFWASPITLHLGNQALWKDVLVTCVKHFGVPTIACCLKDGPAILAPKERCGPLPRALTLAPATKNALVSLVGVKDQSLNGRLEVVKLASTTNATSGKATISISCVLKAVANMDGMKAHAKSKLSIWSDDTQSARATGDVVEQPGNQQLGLVKTEDVLALSLTLHFTCLGNQTASFSVDAESTTLGRQCLPDTCVGETVRMMTTEAGLQPERCIVTVDGADDTPLDLHAPLTVGELATESGTLGLSVYPGLKILGAELHKVPRRQTFGELQSYLELPEESRLGDFTSHIVPSTEALVETFWAQDVELGVVRSDAVCTVTLIGVEAEAMCFNALATISDIRRGFSRALTDQHNLLWSDCVLPDTSTLEMILQMEHDCNEDETTAQLTLTASTIDPVAAILFLVPEQSQICVRSTREYSVKVASPETVTLATVKQVACLFYGLPHSCVDVGTCLDLSDIEAEEGNDYEEDDLVSDFMEGEQVECTAISLTLCDECSVAKCELVVDKEAVKTATVYYLPTTPFCRVRSYAKQVFAVQTARIDAEHGCVSAKNYLHKLVETGFACSEYWIKLEVEEADVDEDDFGESMEDLGAGDTDLKLLVSSDLAFGEQQPEQPPEQQSAELEHEPEPQADVDVEPEPEPGLNS